MEIQAYGETLTVITNEYRSGGIAVGLVDSDGCPFGTVSVNLPQSSSLPAGAFYVKHWSENEPLVSALLSEEILVPVDAPEVSSGFISGIKAYRLKA